LDLNNRVHDPPVVSVVVKNVGALSGHEVAQLYLEFPEAAEQPLRSLRGFERTLIPAGGQTTVNFQLEWDDLNI